MQALKEYCRLNSEAAAKLVVEKTVDVDPSVRLGAWKLVNEMVVSSQSKFEGIVDKIVHALANEDDAEIQKQAQEVAIKMIRIDKEPWKLIRRLLHISPGCDLTAALEKNIEQVCDGKLEELHL